MGPTVTANDERHCETHALLTKPPLPRMPDDASTPTAPDDASGRAHRQLIGYIGLLLPILLILIAAWRPNEVATRWEILESVSAYYYTGAVSVFVGLLVALALFLITYRGYENKYQWADRAVARIAGVAALLVAFFPTRAPHDSLRPTWWIDAHAVLHYSAAVILFSMFAVFCLWLFRLTATDDQPPADKRHRNQVYLVCGVAIVAGMVWAGINGSRGDPIFLPESLALVAFAISWLVKGQVHKTIAESARSLRRG